MKIHSKRLWLISIGLPVIALVMGACLYSALVDDRAYRQAYKDEVHIINTPLPDSLSFCNEPVPLEYYLVRERLDRELIVNAYWQSNIMLLMKRAERYFPEMTKILIEEGIPEDFKYLALIESALINTPSSAGAAGVWHFLGATGKEYGLEVNDDVDERYHVEKSTRAACRYLRKAYEEFGSWTMAAAAFNAGTNAMRRHRDQQNISNYYDLHLSDETMRYVFRILAVKTIFSNPKDYGIYLRKKDLYPPLPYYEMTLDTAINDLFDFARAHQINYQQLKQYNVWLRSSKLPNRSRKSYVIRLPYKDSLSIEKLQSRLSQDALNELL